MAVGIPSENRDGDAGFRISEAKPPAMYPENPGPKPRPVEAAVKGTPA